MCRTKTLSSLKPVTSEEVCEDGAGLCPDDGFIGMGLAFQHQVPMGLCVNGKKTKKPTSQAGNRDS